MNFIISIGSFHIKNLIKHIIFYDKILKGRKEWEEFLISDHLILIMFTK